MVEFMSRDKLRTELGKFGLSTRGTKDDLSNRLHAFEAAKQGTARPKTETPGEIKARLDAMQSKDMLSEEGKRDWLTFAFLRFCGLLSTAARAAGFDLSRL
jgi:hypothetical protein